MSRDLGTPEQYRTLADLIEQRGRKGAVATFQGRLLLAMPDYPVTRIHADGTFDEPAFGGTPRPDQI